MTVKELLPFLDMNKLHILNSLTGELKVIDCEAEGSYAEIKKIYNRTVISVVAEEKSELCIMI